MVFALSCAMVPTFAPLRRLQLSHLPRSKPARRRRFLELRLPLAHTRCVRWGRESSISKGRRFGARVDCYGLVWSPFPAKLAHRLSRRLNCAE